MDALLSNPSEITNDKICYEQVYKSYWLAKYGGQEVVMHRDTGYVNVTKLCKAQNKQFGHWNRNKGTKDMSDDLAEKLTHNGSPVTRAQMIFVVEGGSGKNKKNISGTYVHPILLPHVVSWLDSDMAGVVSIIANNFWGLQTKTGKLDAILADMKAPPKRKEEKEPKEADVDLDASSSEDEEETPEKFKKYFKIFTRNDEKYPYFVIEAGKQEMEKQVKKYQKSAMGKNTEVLLEINDIPDVV